MSQIETVPEGYSRGGPPGARWAFLICQICGAMIPVIEGDLSWVEHHSGFHLALEHPMFRRKRDDEYERSVEADLHGND